MANGVVARLENGLAFGLMEWLTVFLVVYVAIFTQSIAGFGLALIAMPVLSAVLGIQTAAPLVAMLALVTQITLLLYYHEAVDVHAIWRMALAAVLGIPLGVLVLESVEEQAVLTLLGVILVWYALYGLLKFRMPAVRGHLWAYLAGFLGGVLGGAYNTSGPPVIVYANASRWEPAAFKANLQGFFMVNTVVILFSHGLAQNYTIRVWESALIALPAAGFALFSGLRLSRAINAATFSTLVLWLLLVLGLWLLLN